MLNPQGLQTCLSGILHSCKLFRIDLTLVFRAVFDISCQRHHMQSHTTYAFDDAVFLFNTRPHISSTQKSLIFRSAYCMFQWTWQTAYTAFPWEHNFGAKLSAWSPRNTGLKSNLVRITGFLWQRSWKRKRICYQTASRYTSGVVMRNNILCVLAKSIWKKACNFPYFKRNSLYFLIFLDSAINLSMNLFKVTYRYLKSTVLSYLDFVKNNRKN